MTPFYKTKKSCRFVWIGFWRAVYYIGIISNEVSFCDAIGLYFILISIRILKNKSLVDLHVQWLRSNRWQGSLRPQNQSENQRNFDFLSETGFRSSLEIHFGQQYFHDCSFSSSRLIGTYQTTINKQIRTRRACHCCGRNEVITHLIIHIGLSSSRAFCSTDEPNRSDKARLLI